MKKWVDDSELKFNLGILMKRFMSCVGVLVVAASCSTSTTTGSGAGGGVIVTDAARVADCQVLTSITESVHSGLLFAGSGLQAAQARVLDTAAQNGATHVVWSGQNSGGVVQSATALAYRCSA